MGWCFLCMKTKQCPESRLSLSVSRHTLRACRTVMVLAVSPKHWRLSVLGSQLVSRHTLGSDTSYCTLIFFLASLQQTHTLGSDTTTLIFLVSLIGLMFYCEMWLLLNCLYVFNRAGSSSTCWILTVTPNSYFQLVFKHAKFFQQTLDFYSYTTLIFSVSLQTH